MSRMMRVRNLSRNTDLATRATMADSFWPRVRGLLGRKGLAEGEGMVIVPCNSIHMVGMQFALDVLHVKRDGTVLKMLSNIRPGWFGPMVWRSHLAVELPVGTIAASGTALGDQIVLEPVV